MTTPTPSPSGPSSGEQEREAFDVEVGHKIEDAATRGIAWMAWKASAALARPLPSGQSGEALLLQDENSGREGRRYNEWHASRPDARLNAREAAAALSGHSAPGKVEADAARFCWLTEDHADKEARVKRDEILERMPVMSYSAACAAIDAAMLPSAPAQSGEGR